MDNKEFDRSIAFTFYAEWAQDAASIEEDYGLEGYAQYCKAIINYALYETEIDAVKKPPIKYFWNTIKEKIDASQAHRAKGFTKEDTELTEKIREYKTNNPKASQREIAEALNCSVGKVNKALKDFTINPTSTNTITNTDTDTLTITSVNVNANAHDSAKEGKQRRELEAVMRDLSCQELENIKKMLLDGIPYVEVAAKYGISYFDADKFKALYDSVHAEQYDREHPEEVEQRRKAESERIQRQCEEFVMIENARRQIESNRKKRIALEDIEEDEI